MEWILTQNDLPPECTIVWGYCDYWKDEDYNPEGVRECFYNDGIWISAKWNNEQDCFDTEDGIFPTHWMQLPKPPNP